MRKHLILIYSLLVGLALNAVVTNYYVSEHNQAITNIVEILRIVVTKLQTSHT